MATQLRTITADEFLALPNDGIRRELVEGELCEMSPAGLEHSVVAANFATALNYYVRKHKLGVVGTADPSFRLVEDPDTVRVPDIAFVRRDRLPSSGVPRKFWNGAPDMAIEVISPNDRYSEVRMKVAEYLDAGTQMVVVIDPPRRSVTVYRSRTDVAELTEEDVLDGADVIPGWTLPIREIFPDFDLEP